MSEFEAVISHAVIAIDKELLQSGDNPKLKEARRDLLKIEDAARDNDKVKGFRARLAEIGDVLRAEMSKATQLHDDMWDLLDFIDYRL